MLSSLKLWVFWESNHCFIEVCLTPTISLTDCTLTEIAQQLSHQQWLFLLRFLRCKNNSVLNSRRTLPKLAVTPQLRPECQRNCCFTWWNPPGWQPGTHDKRDSEEQQLGTEKWMMRRKGRGERKAKKWKAKRNLNNPQKKNCMWDKRKIKGWTWSDHSWEEQLVQLGGKSKHLLSGACLKLPPVAWARDSQLLSCAAATSLGGSHCPSSRSKILGKPSLGSGHLQSEEVLIYRYTKMLVFSRLLRLDSPKATLTFIIQQNSCHWIHIQCFNKHATDRHEILCLSPQRMEKHLTSGEAHVPRPQLQRALGGCLATAACLVQNC